MLKLSELEEEHNEVDQWFLEALSHHDCISVGKASIIYKGFKISKKEILDIRKSDLYNPVEEKDLKIFRKHGFVTGADRIMYERYLLRHTRCKTLFLDLVTKKYNYKEEGNNRKYRYCVTEMAKVLDLQFLLECRIKQIQKKYLWD